MKLIELGGPPFMLPTVQRDKVYELAGLARALGRENALVAGAGAGPWPWAGVNCEVGAGCNVRAGVGNVECEGLVALAGFA